MRVNWFLKAMGFHLLGRLPGGGRCYQWAQENISRSLEPTEERLSQKLQVALRYHDSLKQAGWLPRLPQTTHLDLGAGWQPTLPLFFFLAGCPRQVLLDVVPVMTAELARKTAQTFRRLALQPAWQAILPTRRITLLDHVPWADWNQESSPLGWQYIAPYGAWLERQRNTVDLATSTGVLLHPPRPVVEKICRLLFQALRPGGLFLGTVPLTDIFATADPHITPYNFLRFSPWFWEHVISSPLMSYNRMRPSDYRHALESAGFHLRTFELDGVTKENEATLRKIRVHPAFEKYPAAELTATALFFVAEKPAPTGSGPST
jgi:SAM-dependent methyltransferase